MARIRSIHPNTPTDPDLAAIPIPGRLLFIYSWTVADDAGNLERSPRGLKMALFPGDDTITAKKIEKLVDALIAGRFYVPYEADGKALLHVRNFARYQKIDHPTPPRFPLFPGQVYTYHVRDGNSWKSQTIDSENSTNVQRTTGEHTANVRTGIGRESEGKGKEGTGGVQGTDTECAEARSAPSEGAAASAPDKGNGTFAGVEILIDTVKARLECKETTPENAVKRLVVAGLSPEEAKGKLGIVEIQ